MGAGTVVLEAHGAVEERAALLEPEAGLADPGGTLVLAGAAADRAVAAVDEPRRSVGVAASRGGGGRAAPSVEMGATMLADASGGGMAPPSTARGGGTMLAMPSRPAYPRGRGRPTPRTSTIQARLPGGLPLWVFLGLVAFALGVALELMLLQ